MVKINIDETTLGESGLIYHGDGIDNVTSLPRKELTDQEKKDRIVKYTLVTAIDGKYEIVQHEILDYVQTILSGDESQGPIFEKRFPYGDLLKEYNEKEKLIARIGERDPNFVKRLRQYADKYLNDIKAIVEEYEEIVKNDPEKENDIVLKKHYKKIISTYNETLEEDKETLKEIAGSTASWGHKFSIDHLEYVYPKAFLIGRYSLCQIPIQDEKGSRVSAIQGGFWFDGRKIRYDNLGVNLTTIMRHKQKGESLEHYLNGDNALIDTFSDEHQLAMLFFGKAVPLDGNGTDNIRVMDDLTQSSFKQPQYYLSLELAGR